MLRGEARSSSTSALPLSSVITWHPVSGYATIFIHKRVFLQSGFFVWILFKPHTSSCCVHAGKATAFPWSSSLLLIHALARSMYSSSNDNRLKKSSRNTFPEHHMSAERQHQQDQVSYTTQDCPSAFSSELLPYVYCSICRIVNKLKSLNIKSNKKATLRAASQAHGHSAVLSQ